MENPGKYPWLVLLACMASTASYGMFLSMTIFFRSLQVEFGWNYTVTSSIHSLHLLVMAASMLLMGRVLDKFGAGLVFALTAFLMGIGFSLLSQTNTLWQFYILYIIASLGSAICFTLPMTEVQKWFIKRKGLALGLVSSGGSLGTLIIAPLANRLILSYGWRTSYNILGVSIGAMVLLAALVVARKPGEGGRMPFGAENLVERTDGASALSSKEGGKADTGSARKDWTVGEALRNRQFYILASSWIFSGLPTNMVMLHTVPFALTRGISSTAAAAAFGLLSVFNAAGRIVGGAASEKLGRARTYIVCTIINGLVIAWLIKVQSIERLLIFVVIFGFSIGGRLPQIPGLVGDYYGTSSLATLMGIQWAIGCTSGVFGPLLAGHVMDATQSYVTAFIVAAVSSVLAAIGVFLAKPPSREEPAE